jgi:predicted nucleic acid-binding protein
MTIPARILVDSSVWIWYLRGDDRPQARLLDDLLAGRHGPAVDVSTTGLVVTEVLQGLRSDRQFREVRERLADLPSIDLADIDFVNAADLYRRARKAGATPRSTIDLLLAALCARTGSALLHDDRDFAVIEELAGLEVVEAG